MSDQGCVLVCVANPSSCRHIVEAGIAIAQSRNLPVKVVSVLNPGLVTNEDARTMQQLHNITRRCGTELTVFFNDSPALMTAVYARQCNAVHIVSGIPGGDGAPKATPFVEMLRELLSATPFTLVDPDSRTVELPVPAAV
ncbi:MAG: hypothetical protein J6K98_00520 [Clostridia bacterium]|nr:hypothetical protein [Clostridia bacterium]